VVDWHGVLEAPADGYRAIPGGVEEFAFSEKKKWRGHAVLSHHLFKNHQVKISFTLFLNIETLLIFVILN
jgi:hypothetical protein